MVAITPTGTSTAGSMYTLTCTVTVVENLVAQPTVEWLDSDSMTVMSGSDITVGSVMRSGSMSTLTLEFNPLHTSHGGQYTCRATINIPNIVTDLSNSAAMNIIVQSMYSILSVSRVHVFDCLLHSSFT